MIQTTSPFAVCRSSTAAKPLKYNLNAQQLNKQCCTRTQTSVKLLKASHELKLTEYYYKKECPYFVYSVHKTKLYVA